MGAPPPVRKQRHRPRRSPGRELVQVEPGRPWAPGLQGPCSRCDVSSLRAGAQGWTPPCSRTAREGAPGSLVPVSQWTDGAASDSGRQLHKQLLQSSSWSWSGAGRSLTSGGRRAWRGGRRWALEPGLGGQPGQSPLQAARAEFQVKTAVFSCARLCNHHPRQGLGRASRSPEVTTALAFVTRTSSLRAQTSRERVEPWGPCPVCGGFVRVAGRRLRGARRCGRRLGSLTRGVRPRVHVLSAPRRFACVPCTFLSLGDRSVPSVGLPTSRGAGPL